MIRTQEELFQLLNGVVPTCYNDWEGYDAVPEPPYIAYLFEHSNNFGADNKVYTKASSYSVELYIKSTDRETELLLEQAFDEGDIFWDKTTRGKLLDSNLVIAVYRIII